ncbi:MAG: hypothetical protein RG741_09125 [Bacteroidales bacterium]|nr:hypothetical protein [Bacteroidales bacterium]
MYINTDFSIKTGLFAVLLLLFAVAAGAQNTSIRSSSAVRISASAVVTGADIELETISDMGIIDAQRMQQDNIVFINPVFDPEADIMRARGNPGAQIRVSYLEEMEVTRREGPGVLFFEYIVSGYPGDNQRESELLDQIERELRFNEDGEFYFYIGGRINLSEALPGNYDGEFTIEIEYM